MDARITGTDGMQKRIDNGEVKYTKVWYQIGQIFDVGGGYPGLWSVYTGPDRGKLIAEEDMEIGEVNPISGEFIKGK